MPVSASARATVASRSRWVNWRTRQVDGDAERPRVRPRRVPERGLRAGGVEHPAPDRLDQPALLGDRDELGGTDETALGMLPAQQRLDRADRAVVQRDDRLVDDAQLVALERAPQVVLDRQALDRARAHRAVEHLEASASALLGLVHRGVGVADQRWPAACSSPSAIAIPRLALAKCSPALSSNGSSKALDDALGDARCRALVGDVLEQHDELVAAEPCDRVAGAQRVLQPRRDLASAARRRRCARGCR